MSKTLFFSGIALSTTVLTTGMVTPAIAASTDQVENNSKVVEMTAQPPSLRSELLPMSSSGQIALQHCVYR